MNFNHYCFLDFEATAKSKYTAQPVQLAAIIIDGRKLTIQEEFSSLIKPIFDEEICKKKKLAPLTQESIDIHKKTKEMLEGAPDLKTVWSNFVEFVNRYNPKKDVWKAPILCGFNIENYDCELVRRCCEQHGPYDKEYQAQALFHPFIRIDIIRDVFNWTENNPDIKSISMDSVRNWLGISKEGAHDALKDVKDGVDIMIKFLKLYRHFGPKVKFAGAFNGQNI